MKQKKKIPGSKMPKILNLSVRFIQRSKSACIMKVILKSGTFKSPNVKRICFTKTHNT